MKPTDFSVHVTHFLTHYLAAQRNLSPNTIKAYRDVFTLLLRFCRDDRRLALERLSLAQIDADLVEAFLDHLAQDRPVAAGPEGRVEVDEVDPLRALGLEVQRGVQGGSIGGLGAGLTLDKAHGSALADVDGGQEREGGKHVRKASRSQCDRRHEPGRCPARASRARPDRPAHSPVCVLSPLS